MLHGLNSIEGLGIFVQARGRVNVAHDRICKILDCLPPTNRTEVLGFIGMDQWAHPHIKNLTEFIPPLQESKIIMNMSDFAGLDYIGDAKSQVARKALMAGI